MKRKLKNSAPNPIRARRARPQGSPSAPEEEGPSLSAVELTGLLDSLKATVIALLASLKDKERVFRASMERQPTDGVRTGLEDIHTLRRWAEKTYNTIEVLEKCEPGRLGMLLEELGEFERILHAQDTAADPR